MPPQRLPRRFAALVFGMLLLSWIVAPVSGQLAGAAPPPGESAREKRDAIYQAYVRSLEGSDTQVVSYPELRSALADYQVVVLGGYSGLDYQYPKILEQLIRSLVEEKGDGTAYVLGGTADGIGRAYGWIPGIAAELGLSRVVTAGIVSRNAAEYGVAPQQLVVFVDTDVDDWEVVVEGRSLMVDIAKQAGGEMVYFRGGAVSRAEIEEALDLGVPVRLYAGNGLDPNADKLARRKARDPDYEADGTEEFARKPPPGLRLITVHG